jgi:hypothetical protein
MAASGARAFNRLGARIVCATDLLGKLVIWLCVFQSLGRENRLCNLNDIAALLKTLNIFQSLWRENRSGSSQE